VSYGKIRHRLYEGRPIVVDSDVAASLGARGCSVDEPGALGAVLFRDADRVREHHLAELSCRVDVLSALTADTTPRALSESGMEHRSARLTGKALDIVMDLAERSERPVAVAGVLGSDQINATMRGRFEEETGEHAERIAFAGADIIIVRGMGSRLDLVFSVAAASRHDIPTWAVVDQYVGEGDFGELLQSVSDAGAEAILFEVSSVDEGLEKLRQVRESGCDIVPGALLSAAPDALRGFPSPLFSSWVDRVVELTDAGARIVGGGAGTTEAHTRALVTRLGVIHPSMPPVGTRPGGDLSTAE
jgi:S-methylmethionine-dependent homocysteine/selenocysteine methylase